MCFYKYRKKTIKKSTSIKIEVLLERKTGLGPAAPLCDAKAFTLPPAALAADPSGVG